VRKNLENKTDREVVIELHVLMSNMLKSLESIDGKLEGIDEYSDTLESVSDSVTDSLQTAVATLQAELYNSLYDIDSTISNAVSDSCSSLDEDDVRSAVRDALNYDSYSFINSL
jgi:uncharacterized protein YjgD (DUF1641 family)